MLGNHLHAMFRDVGNHKKGRERERVIENLIGLKIGF